MANLDDLNPADLPGFTDDESTGQTDANPTSVAEADQDAPPRSPDDPGGPGVHPFYADDDAATGR